MWSWKVIWLLSRLLLHPSVLNGYLFLTLVLSSWTLKWHFGVECSIWWIKFGYREFTGDLHYRINYLSEIILRTQKSNVWDPKPEISSRNYCYRSDLLLLQNHYVLKSKIKSARVHLDKIGADVKYFRDGLRLRLSLVYFFVYNWFTLAVSSLFLYS